MSMWDKEGAATDRKQEPYHNFMGRRMREEDATGQRD